jgi:hypothetical protein
MGEPAPEIQEAELVEPGAELVPIEPEAATLYRTSDPRVALERMAEIAKQVANVIDSQRLYARISGKKYVTCPGWKTAGGMLGLAPYTVWTKPNETGDGYVARVEIRTLDERTIAAAEAECARDEPNWKDRPKHAVRSMAETRATSRAFRGPLEQIFVLAGFEPTAAEEMPAGHEPVQEREPSAVGHDEPSTDEQLEEILVLIRTLEGIDTTQDWPAIARGIAGGTSGLLSRGQAETVIERLRERLAGYDKAATRD